MKKIYLVIWIAMIVLLAACSDTGEVSYMQETESSLASSVESMDALNQYVIKDSHSKNCYQAFQNYVSTLNDAEWKGFQLVDFDGDKSDELIAIKHDPDDNEKDELRYYVIDWADHKVSITEVEPSTEIPKGDPLNKLEYHDKDYMLLVLSAEGTTFFEGVTKKDKDLYYLVVGVIWIEEGWAEKPRERREAMEDYYVLSELGEKTDYIYDDGYFTRIPFQYKMRTSEVTEVYKEVFGWEREYSPNHDSSSEIGVRNESDGYLYGHNEIGWTNYPKITKIEQSEGDLAIYAVINSAYTDEHLADVTVIMAANDGKYGYTLQGYEVARETDMDPESGQKLEEFQSENLQIQYVMQPNRYANGTAPVIKDLRFMGNDKEQFTANAKQLLTELKKEYEANPGNDGSNVAAKSTLLAAYEFANNSKILIYEDAVYGNVPPETGDGAEYGYYLNYYILTPGDLFMNGEIFRYNESFGNMPANRKGKSLCRHCFLGLDSMGDPVIDNFAYVTDHVDFANEILFYAEVGRSHDMTWDELNDIQYDEDFYVYRAYFRPDGTRIINQYDTWQIATSDYVSHGAFIKAPNEKTLFEEMSGEEGHEFYAEGKKLSLGKKPEDTVDTFCDVALDASAKLVGQIYYWDWEGCVKVELVLYVDGVEARHELYSNKIYW